MIKTNQTVYTFYGVTTDQVDDLCELWQESVEEWSHSRGFVRIKSDPISIQQFLMFYELYEYLEYGDSAVSNDLRQQTPVNQVLSIV